MLKKCIPKISTNRLDKEWKSYKLREYSNYRRGSFPQPYGNKEWYGGENAMPFVQVVDVLDNLQLAADTKQKISALAQPLSVFVPSDSVIVTLQGSIGRVAVTQYDAYVDRTILVFENYILKTNKDFWAYVIQNKFEIERQKAPGGTIKTITKESLSDFKVSIPDYMEQSAIGSLFRTLDDLLASYKDNLANYQSLKATMLTKMFPKAGQTVPEIRLDGFDGEWELIKLGEFCDLITKGTTAKSQAEQGKVNFVKVENLKDNEIYPIVKISEEEHLGSLKRSILCEGDILFSIAGTLGRTAIVRNNILPANTNQALAIIRGYKLDVYFLLVVLSGEVVKDYIRKNPTVGAQPNLSLEQVSSLKIQVPSIEEQQAIGSYFSNLDNLIAAHQEKISQLETLKKKLLQDMFI